MCLKPTIAFETGLKTSKGKDAYYLDLNHEAERTKQGWILFLGQNQAKYFKIDDINYIKAINGLPYAYKSIETPCGHCLECQMNNAKEWATRIYLEAKQHTCYYFTTLTYNEIYYSDQRDFKRDFQLFMKRLRKNTGLNIRYFSQFEHGEHTKRGHFHCILFFNEKPKDKLKFLKQNANNNYYSSDIIQKAWGLGYDVTTLNEEPSHAINYVSRYCLKKSGEDGFHLQSRNPAIGECEKNILEKYHLIHINKKTWKAPLTKYAKAKIEEEGNTVFIEALKDSARKWINLKYLEPEKETLKGLGEEAEEREKLRNLIAQNKTKIKRRI